MAYREMQGRILGITWESGGRYEKKKKKSHFPVEITVTVGGLGI